MAEQHDSKLTHEEQQQVDQHAPPPAKVVHASVSKQGDDELDRPPARCSGRRSRPASP
jgi:hypothetical protein